MLKDCESGWKIVMNHDYLITKPIIVKNKSNIRITGKGTIRLSNAGPGGKAFFLQGTIENCKIDSLALIGERWPDATYHQMGVCFDADVASSNFRGVVLEKLYIKNLNIGIFVCSYTLGNNYGTIVKDNWIENMVGSNPMQGYGIAIHQANRCIVANNIIINANRHSIYQSYGNPANNIITGNQIIDHCKESLGGQAIVIDRSTHVICSDNLVKDFYVGGLEISASTSDSRDCSHIIVSNNIFYNRKSTDYPTVSVGEAAIPGTYTTHDILLDGNIFYEDYSVVGGSKETIRIHNGKGITIKNNRFQCVNITAGFNYILLGHPSYIDNDDDCTEIEIVDNTFTSYGTTLTGVNIVEVCSDICGNTSKHRILRNETYDVGAITYDATRTNLNIKVDDLIWTNASFGTGWSNYGSPYYNVQYKKLGDFVFIRGMATSGANLWATYPIIFTLPTTYRPAKTVTVPEVVYSAKFGIIQIPNTGAVTWVAGGDGSGYISLDEIVFSVEA